MRNFLLFLLLLPFAEAFDCTSIDQALYDDCVALAAINEDLIAQLLYNSSFVPDHDFVEQYNSAILVTTPPANTVTHNNGIIRNAWFTIVTIQPSIKFEHALYIPEQITVRTAHDYYLQTPDTFVDDRRREGRTCRIEYDLHEEFSAVEYLLNDRWVQGTQYSIFIIQQDTLLQARFRVQTTLRHEIYEWDERNDRWYCEYERTEHSHNEVVIGQEQFLRIYQHPENLSLTFTEHYHNTYQALLNDTQANYHVRINDSTLTRQHYYFFANFTHAPYYFLQLHALPINRTTTQGMYRNGNTLYLPENQSCIIHSYAFFDNITTECSYTLTNTTTQPITTQPFTQNIYFVLYFAIIAAILWSIWKLLKKYAGKFLITLLFPMLAISVRADDCGLTNLASCLPEAFFSYLTNLINQPLQPLLNLIRYFLEEPVSIDIFFHTWLIILYIMGFFYVIMLTIAGFRFLTAGSDIAKRVSAKEWLQNTLLMIFFTSSSFLLYGFALEASASLASGFLSLVDPTFFLLTIDNFTNVALEFIWGVSYLLILLITIILLGIRYVYTSLGILFLPFGLLCYFIPPIRSYGTLILHSLAVCVCIPVAVALVILACASMLTLPFFEHIKIVLMIACFAIADIVVALAFKHVIAKSGATHFGQRVVAAGKYLAAFL